MGIDGHTSERAERLPMVGEVSQARHLLAIAAVIFKDKHVLAVRRDAVDYWEPPTQVLSKSGGPHGGIYRFMRGLDIRRAGVLADVEKLSGIYPNIVHPKRPITMGWRCRYVSGEPIPSNGIAAVEWIPQDEVTERMSPIAAMCVQHAAELIGDMVSGRAHDGYDLLD